jgi:hypothetical protein
LRAVTVYFKKDEAWRPYVGNFAAIINIYGFNESIAKKEESKFISMNHK